MKINRVAIRTLSMLGHCGAFGLAAMELPAMSDDVVVLTPDLVSYSGLERFSKEYPDRLYNFGISEQNLLCVAGGMAKEGYLPFVTSYASFATTRACDQVKICMGDMHLGIKLIGLGAGLSVSLLGFTHMSNEDVAIMRTIPNITILSPSDGLETVKMTKAAVKIDGPVYLRLSGPMNAPVVYNEDYDLQIGKAVILKNFSRITIIATGALVSSALQAAEMIEMSGAGCGVVNMHTLNPLCTASLDEACNSELIVTLEEHSVRGGLGGGVAEYISSQKNVPRLLRLGIPPCAPTAGVREKLLQEFGLTAELIAKRILAEI